MTQKQVDAIRAFNRFYTNIIGLLDQHILDSCYALPEVRILYEIYHHENVLASDIITTMHIDKGYLSRILHQFEKEKLITKKRSAKDGRAVHITLTAKGRKEFEKLDNASDKQIKNINTSLTEDDCNKLVAHMTGIEKILQKTKRI